jgi:hypothetical protein
MRWDWLGKTCPARLFGVERLAMSGFTGSAGATDALEVLENA